MKLKIYLDYDTTIPRVRLKTQNLNFESYYSPFYFDSYKLIKDDILNFFNNNNEIINIIENNIEKIKELKINEILEFELKNEGII